MAMLKNGFDGYVQVRIGNLTSVLFLYEEKIHAAKDI